MGSTPARTRGSAGRRPEQTLDNLRSLIGTRMMRNSRNTLRDDQCKIITQPHCMQCEHGAGNDDGHNDPPVREPRPERWLKQDHNKHNDEQQDEIVAREETDADAEAREQMAEERSPMEHRKDRGDEERRRHQHGG
jgi:hypothetical protein